MSRKDHKTTSKAFNYELECQKLIHLPVKKGCAEIPTEYTVNRIDIIDTKHYSSANIDHLLWSVARFSIKAQLPWVPHMINQTYHLILI